MISLKEFHTLFIFIFYTFYRGEKYENNPLCYCSINLLQKQTILYCLFSSFSAFLLIACLTLYHLQSALANQVQDRLSFIGASASTELLPALELASRFYIKGIFSLFFLFAFLFIFFFYYSVRQNKQELINWRLTGLSKTKLFLFIFWQLFFPLFLCCILVLLWIVSFQSVYEVLLQRINFLVLKTTELPDIRDILTSVSGLTIPMDQQTFLPSISKMIFFHRYT